MTFTQRSDPLMNGLRRTVTQPGGNLVSAFVFAITWVVVMHLGLPETDGAYGQAPSQDPIEFIAMASALIGWRFYIVSGWKRSAVWGES